MDFNDNYTIVAGELTAKGKNKIVLSADAYALGSVLNELVETLMRRPK